MSSSTLVTDFAPRRAWLARTVPPLLIWGALAWFALPMFTATYNEGFQTTLVMNARAILSGAYADTDPLHGLNNDFFMISRFGVCAALAGLLKLGLAAEAAFRILMLGSLMLLVSVNAALLAWRFRVHPVLACVPSLLFPGLFESAWFFNDNVLSAALSSSALLLFWRRPTTLAAAGTGVLWGLAVACRSDAVLIAPAFAVLAWFDRPDWRTRIRHALVAGPIAVAVPFLVYGAFGLNFLDILPLTRRATELWARQDPWSRVLQPMLKGFALPGMLLAVAGAVAILARRAWREVSLCLGVPLLYAAAYGRMLTEVRYLLPLTPFFGILIIEGWRAILAASRPVRRLAVLALGGAALTCFVPPVLPGWAGVRFMAADHDMPRPLLGRFWSPVFGMTWNATLSRGADAIAIALDDQVAPGRTTVVLSTYWTPDRMVDLVLRERGLALSAADTPPECRRIAEVFIGGGATVVHVRAHLPMIPTERSAVNWRVLGLPCLRALGKGDAEPVIVVGWMQLGQPPAGLGDPGITPLHVPSPDAHPWTRSLANARWSYFTAQATADAVPALLSAPADAAEQGAAERAIAHPGLWAVSALKSVR